jgi:hypothetical protein
MTRFIVQNAVKERSMNTINKKDYIVGGSLFLLLFGGFLLAIGTASNECQHAKWENVSLKQEKVLLEMRLAVMEHDLKRLNGLILEE